MSDLHELTAVEQLRILRAGEVSSRDLTQHYLERIDRLDGSLRAFVTVTAELALEEAAGADECLAQGSPGPLLGLPLGIKDLYTTAGAPTTFGCAAAGDVAPRVDSWTVGLLRQAGAVLVGKTNASEFGATCFTENLVTPGPTVTPFDPSRYASGSSGGAAVAVAAGLLPLGHAADGAGSTRTPAATCHLVGLKPSRGLVSSAVPATSLCTTTIEGPVARTVEDAALLLDVMARPWSGELHGWQADGIFAEAAHRPPAGPLEVGVWTDTGLAGVEPHPQARLAVERTATLLQELGHHVREVTIPAACDEAVRRALRTWFAAAVRSSVTFLVAAERMDLLTPYTRYLYDEGGAVSATDLLAAQGVLARYASAFLAGFDSFDVALTPTTNGPPVPIGHFVAGGVDEVADRMLTWSCYTPWANFSGQPAVSLPSHLDADGLPHAVQLVGRPRHDADLFSLAGQLERADLWGRVHPLCWDQ